MAEKKTRHALYKMAVKQLQALIETCKEKSILRALNAVCYIVPDTFTGMYTTLKLNDLFYLHNPDKDYLLILQTFDTLVERFPESIYPRLLRARALWAIEYYAASLEDLSQIVYYDSNNVVIHLMIAFTLYFMKKFNESLTYIDSVLEQYPYKTEAYILKFFIFYSIATDEIKTEIKHQYYIYALYNMEKAVMLSPKYAVRYFKYRTSILSELRKSEH